MYRNEKFKGLTLSDLKKRISENEMVIELKAVCESLFKRKHLTGEELRRVNQNLWV